MIPNYVERIHITDKTLIRLLIKAYFSVGLSLAAVHVRVIVEVLVVVVLVGKVNIKVIVEGIVVGVT